MPAPVFYKENDVPNKEISLKDLMTDYDWAQVFADENAGNVDKVITIAPPGAKVDDTPPERKDVAKIIAAVNGERDEASWVGLFLLKDGRYLIAEGACDYTGWDCQAHNSLTVCRTLKDALTFGLSESDLLRLGLKRP